MKIRVEVKLPGAEPLVQVIDVVDPHPIQQNSVRDAYLAGLHARRIQKRYPTAEVSWREVEE